ncbi:MAG: Gfo/Idh/MocA family oxidoreductase [Candidatus Electryonea clarkiae]|nr:Gfo/Idh/MocA family oxidoreductase [Candidatus Electryonea clarkiae]MDP8289221.1 Gfo/Idh/MocA family oxidoreductase [Candidatus Electryonea clarkiae]
MKKEDKKISVVVSGIGGYGYYYLETIQNEFLDGNVKITGVVDPNPENSRYFNNLKDQNIRCFNSIEEFYDRGNQADLAIITSPIHFHVTQSIAALKNGSNVLCEKPVSAIVQDVDSLIKTRDKYKKWVMIGYQWSYSNAIQLLKKDIISGIYGKPLSFKTFCTWPRDDIYYSRNDWAGKIKDQKGNWILDSPAHNAFAHFLHNMFYLLGNTIESSASPKNLIAECYRAYPIDNYDTVVCRMFTEDNVELSLYGSHATQNEIGPSFVLELEDAFVRLEADSSGITASDREGNIKNYGFPDDDHQFLKLFKAIEAVNSHVPIICGPEAARSQVVCVNGIQESIDVIQSFPSSMITRDEKAGRLWVDNLDRMLYDCYKNAVLPSEAGYFWAEKRRRINLTNYSNFTG